MAAGEGLIDARPSTNHRGSNSDRSGWNDADDRGLGLCDEVSCPEFPDMLQRRERSARMIAASKTAERTA